MWAYLFRFFLMALMVITLVYSLGTLIRSPQVQVVLPGVDLPGQAISSHSYMG